MQTRSAPTSLEIVLHHRKDDTHEKVFFFVLGCTADFLLLDGGDRRIHRRRFRFDSEDSLAARQRIYGIASADDLHAILTGYFDPNDAAYTADAALDARLQAILAACGLNPEDYDISVIRNLSGLPEPITGTNWYCTLIRKGVEVAEDETNPYDMVIVLYGDEMTVGAFVLNPEV